MGSETDQIKKHIDERRQELGAHLHELEYRVKSTTDWRAQVRKQPGKAAAVAFAVGLILALIR
jgi:ElaB/YqjD/DUF883 family membrane-anchored ribosome-binding protein